MFTLVDQRFMFVGKDLARARSELNLNISEFAYKCGWTPQYQWNLENDIYESIPESTKKVIENVLDH